MRTLIDAQREHSSPYSRTCPIIVYCKNTENLLELWRNWISNAHSDTFCPPGKINWMNGRHPKTFSALGMNSKLVFLVWTVSTAIEENSIKTWRRIKVILKHGMMCWWAVGWFDVMAGLGYLLAALRFFLDFMPKVKPPATPPQQYNPEQKIMRCIKP